MSGIRDRVNPMKNVCAIASFAACFWVASAFAVSPIETCEGWAVKENVEAADKAEYVDDCVDELSPSDAAGLMESEAFETDHPDSEEQYSEPEVEADYSLEAY